MGLSGPRRFIICAAALLVALRVFWPVQYEVRYGLWRTDLRTTLLHILGILSIATAAFFVIPTVDSGKPKERANRYVLPILLFILLIVGALAGIVYWQQWQEQRLMVSRQQTEQSRHQVVEGERIGMIRLGMSLDQVQQQLGEHFTNASRVTGEIVSYDWKADPFHWEILVDKASSQIIEVDYFLLLYLLSNRNEVQEKLESAGIATTRGVRLGQTAETVEAVYGIPPKQYFGGQDYYYPSLRTSFSFHCKIAAEVSWEKCGKLSREVVGIRIYANGWSPERIYGSHYEEGYVKLNLGRKMEIYFYTPKQK